MVQVLLSEHAQYRWVFFFFFFLSVVSAFQCGGKTVLAQRVYVVYVENCGGLLLLLLLKKCFQSNPNELGHGLTCDVSSVL